MASLAIKYRPSSFSDLVGQLSTAKALKNAIDYKNIGQAYLFFGARGVGKTSTARILAKCLNCETGPTTIPCDKCNNCIEIAEGRNIDVIEMDAASNRGIDHIRNLRENVRFAPMKSHYKIYIIDEVHMLTNEAFNALLKTLEEPPVHVVFILATTEFHKIPETILSRCQTFSFKKFSNSEIIERLVKILNLEKISFDLEALTPIAVKAEGSMRDSISILDQIISFSGEDSITRETVLKILGTIPTDIHIQLLDSVNNKNIHEAIKILRDLHNEGLNLKNFLQTWLEFVKNCLLAKKNLLGQTESVFSNDEIELLKVKLNAWDDADLIKCFEIFNELHSNWSRSLSSNMSENLAHLEIGFMDLFIKLEQPSISSLVQKLSLLQKSMEDGAGFIDQKVKKPVQEKSKKEDIGTIIQKEFGGKEDHADQNLGIFS